MTIIYLCGAKEEGNKFDKVKTIFYFFEVQCTIFFFFFFFLNRYSAVTT